MTPRPLAVLAAAATLAACQSTHILRMEPRSPAWIEQAPVRPIAPGTGVRSLVVTAALEAGREDFMDRVAGLEAALAAEGVSTTVLRPAESGPAAILDVEPALRRARNERADAVLEVQTWAWRPSDEVAGGRRYFVEVAGRDTLAEVDRGGYEAAGRRSVRYWYGNRVLDFRARLLDPATGERLAAFEIAVPRVNVADPLEVELDAEGGVRSASYAWAATPGLDELLAERAAAALFARLAQRLAGG